MEIMGFNEYQKQIADLLWDLETQEEVDQVLNRIGQDARTVYEMMVAAFFDDNTETDMAHEILSQIAKRSI